MSSSAHKSDQSAIDVYARHHGGEKSVHSNASQPEPVSTTKIESFCALHIIRHLLDAPFILINGLLKDKIGAAFFKDRMFWSFNWTIFYLYPPLHLSQDPLLLLHRDEVVDFVNQINSEFDLSVLSLPFEMIVPFNPNLRHKPLCLGIATSVSQFKNLEKTIPRRDSPLLLDEDVLDSATVAALSHVIATAVAMRDAAARRTAEHREKTRAKQVLELLSVKRFLGLHPGAARDAITTALSDPTSDWSTIRQAHLNPPPLPDPIAIDPSLPAPFPFESDVILVCIDIEALEHNQSKLTEIGLATLDTRDVARVPPGPHGHNWYASIKTRHLLVNEYRHVRNRFTRGSPDDFRFGASRVVAERDLITELRACFRYPYLADADASIAASNDIPPSPPRTLVLVGHALANEERFLRPRGFDFRSVPNLHWQHLDTQKLHRAYTGEVNPIGLANLTALHGIEAWGLHNAGNDAVYTLQALLGVAVESARRIGGRGG